MQHLIEKLTLADLQQLEELTGLALDQLSDPATPKAKFMIGLAYIIGRRDNPDYTYHEAQQLTIAQLQELLPGEAEAAG